MGLRTIAPDEAYLDDILVVENSTAPIFRLVDGNQAEGRVLISDATGSAIWKDKTNVADNDWVFRSGVTEADDIYRTGKVTIGDNIVTDNHLHVYSATLIRINQRALNYFHPKAFSLLHPIAVVLVVKLLAFQLHGLITPALLLLH